MSFNTVTVIQDSITKGGNRLITYEIETYRYIWAEVLTHKMLNKNAQSSRAVPVNSVLSVNEVNPIIPIVWGKNKGGMSATEVLEGEELEKVKALWLESAKNAFDSSKKLSELGLHKQWSNRITEPYSRIKVVMSGTEWDNFEWLRDDPEAAQPEIVDLARKIKEAKAGSKPLMLEPRWLHVPYVFRKIVQVEDTYEMRYYAGKYEVPEEVALELSASCCAQVSYRKLDDSLDKALELYDRLFNGAKPHFSPAEHQGVAMKREKASTLDKLFQSRWESGVSHMDKQGNFWSGNLKGFVQNRKILEDSFNKFAK